MFLRLSPVLWQFLVIITANLSAVTIGLSVAWPSPVLVKLKNETQTVLSQPITDEEGSWIVSIGSISGVIMTCILSFVMDKIGRKSCILLSYIPRLAMCFMYMFATEVWLLILARTLAGVADLTIMVVVPTYASEIASKKFRGGLGTLSQVASALGMLIIFGIGPFMPYFELNLMYTCIVVMTIVPMCFIPETPYHLYSKGRKEESLKILTYLRGSETLANDEIKEYSMSQGKVLKKDIFKNKTFQKTYAKVIFLSILVELVGYNAVLAYMQTILHSTQTSMREEIASVANGCIQLLACFFTILLTDKFGRKPIVVTTSFGIGIGMVGLGTFFKLKQAEYEISGFLNFVPLLSMMLVIFCFNAGIGSLAWTVIAELFEGPARALGVSTATGSATVVVFLTNKYFAYIVAAIGAPNTYWMFSFNCVITGLFILFFIPETKGKTFAEIQDNLERRNT